MIIDQNKLDISSTPEWKDAFEEREFEYLKNVINELVKYTESEVAVQYSSEDGKRVFHIYEPFVALNYLGFMSPSVVSLSFKDNNKVEFWFGDDNGIGILSDRLSLERESVLPRNPNQSIDFWHFVDNTGDFHDY